MTVFALAIIVAFNGKNLSLLNNCLILYNILFVGNAVNALQILYYSY